MCGLPPPGGQRIAAALPASPSLAPHATMSLVGKHSCDPLLNTRREEKQRQSSRHKAPINNPTRSPINTPGEFPSTSRFHCLCLKLPLVFLSDRLASILVTDLIYYYLFSDLFCHFMRFWQGRKTGTFFKSTSSFQS